MSATANGMGAPFRAMKPVIRTLLRHLAATAMGVALALPVPVPAAAQSSGAPRAADELRQMRAELHEIHERCRNRRWSESADLLMQIKKAFSKTTPALLTRMSPEDVSHFSYALASLEDGLISHDMAQLELGFQLSHTVVSQMKSKFPGEVDQELEDMQVAADNLGQNTARGDFQEAQYYLEEIAAGRRRLDTTGMTYCKELWVHFGLNAENLARAARGHNTPATLAAAQAVDRDLREIRDRMANR
jgi:hypothetical protein